MGRKIPAAAWRHPLLRGFKDRNLLCMGNRGGVQGLRLLGLNSTSTPSKHFSIPCFPKLQTNCTIMHTWLGSKLRATSHMRLNVRDHYTSSTLIGGKEKAEPVQVRFTLRLRDQRSMWMQDGCEVYMDFLHGSDWIMIHGHLHYFQKPLLEGRLNTKLGDHGTPNVHNRWFILCYHAWGFAWIWIHCNSIWSRPRHIWLHTTLEGLWSHYMILEVTWNGLRTLSFGLSRFHGHGFWHVCEVALTSNKISKNRTLPNLVMVD